MTSHDILKLPREGLKTELDAGVPVPNKISSEIWAEQLRFPPPDISNGEIHPSCVLRALSESVPADKRINVLDMGRAFGTNVNYYSKFAQKVSIEDFYTCWSEEFQTKALTEEMLQSLLPQRGDVRFDVIFCWDIFDYLFAEDAVTLANYLKRCAAPRCSLVCFVWTAPAISKLPTNFRIVDESKIQYQQLSKERIPSPRHPIRVMQELLAPFHCTKSFLLRHGLQELIFRFPDKIS